jgi:RNA-directed DNA polymerase
MYGWANYFRHAVAQHTFDMLDNFTWWRLIREPRAAAKP